MSHGATLACVCACVAVTAALLTFVGLTFADARQLPSAEAAEAVTTLHRHATFTPRVRDAWPRHSRTARALASRVSAALPNHTVYTERNVPFPLVTIVGPPVAPDTVRTLGLRPRKNNTEFIHDDGSVVRLQGGGGGGGRRGTLASLTLQALAALDGVFGPAHYVVTKAHGAPTPPCLQQHSSYLPQ